MDPLSVTSGVVGIVAFAFQLAKTVSKVRTAVEDMKSAPKEARDLIDRLKMLETACELISVHLDRRKALSNHAVPPSLDLTSKALAQFLAKAQGLEQMLSSLTSSNGTTWKLRPKSDAALLSRLRLVLRKDKINALVQEIDRVMLALQFVIQVDTWTLTSIPQQLPSLPSNDAELTNESINSETNSRIELKDSVPSQSTVPWKARGARNQRRRTFQYLGCITWTITDDTIGEGEEDDANRTTYTRGRIILRLPCSSRRINIQYDCGMGTPSYSLNIVHLFDESSELGLRVWDLMEVERDRGKLHEMVSKRELSIYSRFRFFDWEINLFFLAVNLRWAEGCKYLLQHDFRHEFEEANAPRLFFSRPDHSGACEVTEILLSARPEHMLEMDMIFLLDASRDPEYFVQYLKRLMNSPGINSANLLSDAWKSLVWKIFDHRTVPSSWLPALLCLIEHGVDIHQQCNQGESAYIEILRRSDHPFTADDRACTWLKMLKACGVDLGSYVNAETVLIQRLGIWFMAGSGRRNVVFLDYDGLQVPSWRWALPTGTSANEAFGEFMNIGSDFEEDMQFVAVHPSGPDDFKAWRRREDNPWWTEICFPFCLYPIDCIVGADDKRLDWPWCRRTYNRAVEIRDNRFARRQARKWRKAHPGKEPPSTKMPGTWVD